MKFRIKYAGRKIGRCLVSRRVPDPHPTALPMKYPHSDSSFPAAAILAGGLLFSGPAASAAVLLTEGWEGGTNVFATPTYNYSTNYTQPNGLTPAGGLVYGKGGAGIPGAASTNFYPVPAISLTAGTGISTAQIDAGSAAFVVT